MITVTVHWCFQFELYSVPLGTVAFDKTLFKAIKDDENFDLSDDDNSETEVVDPEDKPDSSSSDSSSSDASSENDPIKLQAKGKRKQETVKRKSKRRKTSD